MTKVNVQNQACADDVPIVFLVGGAITILKNDGVRQWGRMTYPILWKIKHV